MENTYPKSRCGTDQYHRILIETKGERYKKNRSEDERFTLDFVSSKMTPSVHEVGVMTIPVVFHVVHNKDIENISDEQIFRQMEILNRDYRKLSQDILKLPAVWRHLATDTRIEFRLAKRDPAGNATNGITRKRTNIKQFVLSQGEIQKIKFTSEGGENAWDSKRYLNIWVCNIKDLNGYAQFPRGPEDTDGIVLNFWIVGDIGTATSPDRPVTNRTGRTLVHEAGHYLNCFHIWGDDTQLISDCSGTDNVTDTPNQRGPHRGKPKFPENLVTGESCNDTGSNGTMFMNFMDYTDDDNRYMFTVGQVARMHATLSGPRTSLLQSNVLSSPEEEAAITDAMRLPAKVYDGVEQIVEIAEKL
jgi:hypothetical protein